MPERNADIIATPEKERAGARGDQAQLALRLVAANARLNAVALVTAAGLILLGLWAYLGIQHSLREIRAAGLQTILDSNIQTLLLWIDDLKAEVEQQANDARVRSSIEALVAKRDGAVVSQVPARQMLQDLLTSVGKVRGALYFRVIDATGAVIVASSAADTTDETGEGPSFALLSEVFRGTPRFFRPDVASAGPVAPSRLRRMGSLAWAFAPVRDAGGNIIAALGLAHRADGTFASLFAVARPGQSGEVFAFDDRGSMLSGSRFADAMAGLVLARDGGGSGSPRAVELRDPGGNLLSGHQPELETAAQPLTRIAALAIASRNKSAAAERTGLILDPYRSYLGVESIGAWRWLAEHDFGVAIEMSAEEAYAPLHYLNLAFSIILALLALTAGAVLWSAVYVKRLRREVGDTRLIGQYRLERQIGEGGMAKVYLARHPLLKRPSALKMLKPHIASHEIIERFEREVQLASQLDHPNTIEIYDYGRAGEGQFYYVMEYLDGETLDQLVTASRPMPVGRAIHVLRQVCAALREAHGRGLVHRDIKPHNIMLCQRGGEFDVVKLLDFGLGKDVQGRESRDITQFQKVLGTPLYMSPERIRNPGDADARSDIYSVGAVGFFLIAGRDLFEVGSDHDLTYHVLHTVPRRLAELVPGVPRRLDDLVARCLAKDRSERPHDILVVMALLDAASVEHPWSQRDAEYWWRERAKRADSAAQPAPA